MATIKKKKINTGSSNNFRTTNPDNDNSITHWISVDDTSIEMKVTCKDLVTEEEVINSWIKIDLNTIKQHPGFADQTLWTVTDTVLQRRDDNGVPLLSEVRVFELAEVFANSYNTKLCNVNTPDSKFFNALVNIFIPYTEDDTLENATIIFVDEPSINTIYDGPSANDFDTENFTTLRDLLDPITMTASSSTIDVDSFTEVTIQTASNIDEIWLDPLVGICNKTRVAINNQGVGKFKVYSTGLESADIIRVKAGFKKYTSLAEFTLTVQ
jgi:hypothetical protein